MGTIERAKQLIEMFIREIQSIDCQICMDDDKWNTVLETRSLTILSKSEINSFKYRGENIRSKGCIRTESKSLPCQISQASNTNVVSFAVNKKYLIKKYMKELDKFKNLSYNVSQDSDVGWISVAIEYVYKWKVHRFTDSFKNYNVEDIPLWVLAILYNFALCVVNTNSIDGAIEELVDWFIEIDSNVNSRKYKVDSKRHFSLPYTFYQRFIHIDETQFKAVKLTLSAKQELDSLGSKLLSESNSIDKWYKLANLHQSEVM